MPPDKPNWLDLLVLLAIAVLLAAIMLPAIIKAT